MELVIFNIGQGRYALRATSVSQVLDVVPVTPLPYAPDDVEGLVNITGAVLLKVDLGLRLGLPMRSAQPQGNLLVVMTGLETVVVPPNRPSRRQDQLDRVYKTTKEKYDAAIEDIRDCHGRGQPVLVGTTSIENSELISQLLTQAKLEHQVLNAKQHAREADIVAQAGRPGMITIATNMAGRGTDIVLGGNVEKEVQTVEADESLSDEERQTRIAALREAWKTTHEQVKAAGGLRIIATERHESRRIDNQLRGRSGRQGDPGSSRFYLSLEIGRASCRERVSSPV